MVEPPVDSTGSKPASSAQLTAQSYARKSAPIFFPKIRLAPKSVIPRKTIAQAPKAEAM